MRERVRASAPAVNTLLTRSRARTARTAITGGARSSSVFTLYAHTAIRAQLRFNSRILVWISDFRRSINVIAIAQHLQRLPGKRRDRRWVGVP